MVIYEDELEHYGRLGMKWYQHRFGEADGRAKYLKKGFKKLEKYTNKAASLLDSANASHESMLSAMNKEANYRLKSATAKSGHAQKRFDKKASKQAKKVLRFENTYDSNANASDDYVKKGYKLVAKMEKMFGGVRMSELDDQQLELGQDYCMNLIDDRLEARLRKEYRERKGKK